jgi:hypothetical protein
MTGTVAAICVSLVIIAAITWVVKRRSPARSNDARHAAGRPAVHLPSDDPYWLEHSQRQAQRHRRDQPRSKIWPAGMAGVVGAASTDPDVGYADESNCDEGDRGGGGCDGGGAD